MKKFVFLFIASMAVFATASAQQLTWLPEIADIKKDAEFHFGPTNETDLLTGADKMMMFLDIKTLQPKQTLSIKEMTKSRKGYGFFWMEHGWTAIGSSQKRQKKGEHIYLTYDKITGNGFAPPINMSDIPPLEEATLENAIEFLSVRASTNGKYSIHSINDSFYVFDASFKLVYKNRKPDLFKINGKDAKKKHTKWFVDNDGNLLLSCIMEEEYEGTSGLLKYKILFLKYDRQSGEFQHQTADLKNGILLSSDEKADYSLSKTETLEGGRDLQTKYDPKSNRIIVAGLHRDETGTHFFTVQYDGNNNRVTPLQKHAIPADLIEKISISSFNGKKVKGSLILQDLMLKANGDVMLLLELDNSTIRTGNGSMFGDNNFKGGAFDIEVLDILYFNLSPENELKYYGNLPKKQVNSELIKELILDEVSFAALAVGNDVHVIYNTLSKAEGRVLMDVKIDANGQISRKNLMNLDKGNAIMPSKLGFRNPFNYELTTDSGLGVRKPVQITENAVVLRARNGKKNSILKISY